jgi:ABC-type transporter MlaC component
MPRSGRAVDGAGSVGEKTSAIGPEPDYRARMVATLRVRWLLAAMLVVTGSEAWAGSATARLDELVTAANRVLVDPVTADQPIEKLAAIRRLVNEAGDWEAAAAGALGREWRARTAVEQREFARLFADLVHRTVVTVIASRARLTDGLRLVWAGERPDGDETVVAARLEDRGGDGMAVEFRMGRTDGTWRVRDVVVAGVSIVANYRAQVAAVLRRASYADLVAEMRSRAGDGPLTATPAMVSARGPIPPAGPRPPQPSTGAPPATPALAGPDPPPAPAPARPDPAPAPSPPGAAASLLDARTAHPTTAVAPAPAQAGPPRTPPPGAAARPDPAASASRTVGGRATPTYWVQVGAFRTVQRATSMASTLGGWSYSIVTGPLTRARDRSADSLARVLVGPFTRHGDAATALRRLQTRGVKGFVTEDRR